MAKMKLGLKVDIYRKKLFKISAGSMTFMGVWSDAMSPICFPEHCPSKHILKGGTSEACRTNFKPTLLH